MSNESQRPVIALLWLLIFAVVLIGGWKLFHLHDRSADQKILIKKSH